VQFNIDNAGRPVDEIIWVDNGSGESEFATLHGFFHEETRLDVMVRNQKNLGVAKGYNRGIVLATGDLVLITGCDRHMPKDFLKTMLEHFEKIPETAVISVYSQPPEKLRERFPNSTPIEEEYNGLTIIPALPMGAKLFRRDLIQRVGHLREDFGMYGWEDVEWGMRAAKFLKDHGGLSYIIPNFQAEHNGSEGIREFNGKDGEDYHAWKQREANDPKKKELMQWCKENEYPYYTPYF
jgi:GT2 family glycosyltransferase